MVALLGLLAAGLLTIAVLDTSVGGTGAENWFSWHPVERGTTSEREGGRAGGSEARQRGSEKECERVFASIENARE